MQETPKFCSPTATPNFHYVPWVSNAIDFPLEWLDCVEEKMKTFSIGKYFLLIATYSTIARLVVEWS